MRAMRAVTGQVELDEVIIVCPAQLLGLEWCGASACGALAQLNFACLHWQAVSLLQSSVLNWVHCMVSWDTVYGQVP